MEKMRRKVDRGDYLGLQPLGCSRRGKGKVSEDLGRTEFTSSIHRGVDSESRREISAARDDSDDDLDMLSSRNKFSRALSPLHNNPKTMKKSHVTSGSFPKARSCSKNGCVNTSSGVEDNNLTQAFSLKLPSLAHDYSSRESMPPSNQLAFDPQRPQTHSIREDGHGTSPLEELSPNRAKRTKASSGKRCPAPFPMQDECLTTKPKKRSPKRLAPFPMIPPSPKRTPRRPQPAPFPNLSPPKSRHISTKDDTKSTRRVPRKFPLDDIPSKGSLSEEEEDRDELILTDNDNNNVLTYGGPRPFPMSMSQFPSQVAHDASGPKRSVNDDEEQRSSKRSRPSPELDSFNGLGSLTLDGDGDIDPTTICPYCDEPWPSAPSPTLISLLERTKRKSYADSRPGNALGLKAPLAAFVELCQRHRFEMTHLPLALARGWPTHLDFPSLPKRIKSFEEELGRFIMKPEESLFWREISGDVKEVGRMRVVSMSGQYATFERTQPGYYGEQGSIIIHQTLYSLFPPDAISTAFIDPLTPDQFLTRVLVPETALLLIQEDMRLPTKEASLLVLDESKKYGVAMFPEQAQGEDVAEVGENLARERAREKRKILEERGEADTDVKRQVEQERMQSRRAKQNKQVRSDVRRKGKGKARGSDTDREYQEDEGWASTSSKRKIEAFIEAPNYNGPTPKSSNQRCHENVDILVNDNNQLTPRPSRTKSNAREATITSWRLKHKPLTSPDMRPNPKPASQYSSLNNPSRKPPAPPRPRMKGDSEWVFDLRHVSPLPDYEDIDFDQQVERDTEDMNFDEVIAREVKAAKSGGSDSDVVVIECDSTPKFERKPKHKFKSRRDVSRGAPCGASDSQSTSDDVERRVAPNSKTRCKPLPAEKSKDGERQHADRADGELLGKTRRRKVTGKDQNIPSQHSWLLEDFSGDDP